MSSGSVEYPPLVIEGGRELTGDVQVQGSKNSFQKVLAGCVRWPGEYELGNVPNIQDVTWLLDQFEHLGGTVNRDDKNTLLNSKNIEPIPILPEITKRSGGSFLFAGALLGRFGLVEIGLPGGDQLGERSINYHLDGFRALGAEIEQRGDSLHISSRGLTGGSFVFPRKTVGGTVNSILAATGSEGGTELYNCAYDPDIQDLVTFINELGGHVEIMDPAKGVIHVKPGDYQQASSFNLTSDANASTTFAIAGALAGHELNIFDVNIQHLAPVWNLLSKMGAQIIYEDKQEGQVTVNRGELKPYLELIEGNNLPQRFYTDWGPQIQVLLTQLKGGGRYQEVVFPNRFAHVPQLILMGAHAKLRESPSLQWVPGSQWELKSVYDQVHYDGSARLTGTRVKANDIRNGAALVLAGLIAEGETTIDDAVHIQRGYENIVTTFRKLGACISWSPTNQ